MKGRMGCKIAQKHRPMQFQSLASQIFQAREHTRMIEAEEMLQETKFWDMLQKEIHNVNQQDHRHLETA